MHMKILEKLDKHLPNRHFQRALGLLLVFWGLMVLTPPFPDFTDGALWVLYGHFTGTNGHFVQVITGMNPADWNWDVVADNSLAFMFTGFLVYGTGLLMLMIGTSLLHRRITYYLNSHRLGFAMTFVHFVLLAVGLFLIIDGLYITTDTAVFVSGLALALLGLFLPKDWRRYL